jgi:ectoine hydroxylase-related dioxygenase (phytanoyl-CoA dioxygenase family)
MNHAIIADIGYSITDSLLTTRECESLATRLASTVIARGRAGARHLMANPVVEELARDRRMIQLAARLVGGSAVPYRATLFEKNGRANWLVPWHQDTALPLEAKNDDPQWGPWSVKAGILYAHAPAWALDRIVALRLHLDASTMENGPLRVIPGSHRAGVLDDDAVAALSRRHDATTCLVPRGGVLAMRPLLLHASSKVVTDLPRRVLHIEYADRLELRPGITLATA